MSLNEGGIVSIRHFSGRTPIKSIIIQATNSTLRIKLIKEFAISNFLESDPIVLGYEDVDNIIYFCESIVESINFKLNYIDVQKPTKESVADRRQFERFPVSFYGEIKPDTNHKRNTILIKNISNCGMCLLSKTEYDEENTIELYFFIGDTQIDLTGEIKRKNMSGSNWEYGLKINFRNSISEKIFKQYIQHFKDDLKNMKSLFEDT